MEETIDGQVWVHTHPTYLGEGDWESRIESLQNRYGGERIGVAISYDALPSWRTDKEGRMPLKGSYDQIEEDFNGYAGLDRSVFDSWNDRFDRVMVGGVGPSGCVGNVINSFLWLEEPPDIIVDPEAVWVYEGRDPAKPGTAEVPATNILDRPDELEQFGELYSDSDVVHLLEP